METSEMNGGGGARDGNRWPGDGVHFWLYTNVNKSK